VKPPAHTEHLEKVLVGFFLRHNSFLWNLVAVGRVEPVIREECKPVLQLVVETGCHSSTLCHVIHILTLVKFNEVHMKCLSATSILRSLKSFSEIDRISIHQTIALNLLHMIVLEN